MSISPFKDHCSLKFLNWIRPALQRRAFARGRSLQPDPARVCGLSFVLVALFATCFLTVSVFAQGFAPPGLGIAPPGLNVAPPALRWESDISVAMARAEREQRPLFLHFVGHDCQPAVQMANEVFVQPSVIAHLNAHFVMVRINASENPVLAQKFEVKSIPTDLILKPNGLLIYRRTGGISVERFSEFLAFLQGKIQSDQGPAPVPHASLPVTNPPGFPSPVPNSVPSPAIPTPVMAQSMAFPETIRDSFMQQPPHIQQPPPQAAAVATVPHASVNPLRVAEVATKPMVEPTLNPPQMPVNPVLVREPVPAMSTVPVIVANEPAPTKMTVEVPLALEGFCPVTLCAEERWVSGNPAFCTMYLGHIFRFASSEALGTFARNPANYIPVAMGEDIVLMVERNKRINGNRKFGAWFQGRVFLFSSQETLDAFANRPEYYTEIALKYELAQKERPTVY